MKIGKLYSLKDEQPVADINYQFHDKSETGWWGEFILTEYKRLDDGDEYAIELEDGRKGKCSIRRRINRAVTSVPPLYRYHFKGRGLLK